MPAPDSPNQNHLLAALPTAEFRVLDGQTHDVDPDVLAPVLIDFFGV